MTQRLILKLGKESTVWSMTTDAFIEALGKKDLQRAYLITDPQTGMLRASHPLLEPLASAVSSDRRDYRNHEACFFELGAESGHLLGAFIHKTRRGQAAGGVRFWGYPSLEAFVRDGLRLSRGMGLKCALAGLWWGGGKGIIARQPGADHTDPGLRAAVFADYGRFISGLAGCYITAEDVGTTTADMAKIFEQTRHTTCIPEVLGGSGNPSVLTATGVVVAMEAALKHLGLGSLAGKTVAMQGLGNVACYLIKELLDRQVGQIIGADIDGAALGRIAARYSGAPLTLRQAKPEDLTILAEPCDILAPNAVGGILNPRTIPELSARIVCGAANNQLEDSRRDARALAERGILYVPDFLANRMGIVNCANEQYGVLSDDPMIVSHLQRETLHGVFQTCLTVFSRATSSGGTPAEEAEQLAEERSEELHPLWGHRGQIIINDLVARGWAS